jgi:hypothetical protein
MPIQENGRILSEQIKLQKYFVVVATSNLVTSSANLSRPLGSIKQTVIAVFQLLSFQVTRNL